MVPRRYIGRCCIGRLNGPADILARARRPARERFLHRMDYLQQLYAQVFGAGDQQDQQQQPQHGGQRKVIVFGNVLLDRSIQLPDEELLKRYQLTANARGELDAATLTKLMEEACAGGGESETNPGGSGLNTVRIFKQLGTDVLFCGAVGADRTAEQLTDVLEQRGIDARLQIVPEAPTGQCLCMVHDDNATLVAHPGASMKFSIDHLKRLERDEQCAFLRPAHRKQIIYIEGFFVPEREHVCRYIVDNYVTERRRLALNLSAEYIVKENFAQIRALAARAFFIFGNYDEFSTLMHLSGCATLDQLAEQLVADGGAKLLLVTKGADGVQLITNVVDEYARSEAIEYQCYHAPRVDVVVDTTGAGDAFVAGFLHGWLSKLTLNQCIRMAGDVSAKVVTQVGCNLP